MIVDVVKKIVHAVGSVFKSAVRGVCWMCVIAVVSFTVSCLGLYWGLTKQPKEVDENEM